MKPFLTNNECVNALIGAGVLLKSSTCPQSREWALITVTVAGYSALGQYHPGGRVCVGGVGTFNATAHDKITKPSDALKRCGR